MQMFFLSIALFSEVSITPIISYIQGGFGKKKYFFFVLGYFLYAVVLIRGGTKILPEL